jgi:PilZ domain
MSWDGKTDRRSHRRAAIRIRSEFGDPKSPTWVETVDFSAGGFACWMNHPVQPLTRLALRFEFPPFGAEEGRSVQCEAVAVRCEKRNGSPQSWTVAAAFTGLARGDRDYIERYVDWHEQVTKLPESEESIDEE